MKAIVRDKAINIGDKEFTTLSDVALRWRTVLKNVQDLLYVSPHSTLEYELTFVLTNVLCRVYNPSPHKPSSALCFCDWF